MDIKAVLISLIFLFASCKNNSKREHIKADLLSKSSFYEESENAITFFNRISLDPWDLEKGKANWFKRGLSPQKDLNKIEKDFLWFYNRFTSDSLYQSKHVRYESLIGVIGECDTTIILNSRNWVYDNWNFLEFFDNDNNIDSINGWNNTYYSSSNKFYYEFILKEAGVIYQVGFELIESKWQLTLYYVNNC